MTDAKDQERAEKIRSDEIHGIIDGIGDLLFVIDKNRVITIVNKATCEAFKKKPEEMIGRHCYEVVHGTKTPWCNCPAANTFETKQIVTEEVNDPRLGIPLLVTTSPILDEQGEVAQIIHIAKDITKLKLAETEFHIAANLFAEASDSITVHDLDGRIIFFNESAYKSRGYTEGEFQSLTVKDLEVPGSPKILGERLKELLEKGEATFEAENLRKDKTVFPVEIRAQVIESDGRKVILTVARNITERKKNEEKLRESNRRIELMNEKLRVVGSLTRHDVRNKLSTITGYAYLLKKKHADQSDVVEGLGKMEQAVRDSMRIFEFAKMYEQIGVEKLTYIDVEKAIDEAVALLSGLTIKVANDCRSLTVMADSFLRQLFYNFIDNTRKYGQITTTIRVYYEKTDQGNLKLVYEDDGVGIPFENKTKLFIEGFSTGGSTGYGLFLTNKMIDVYGWKIEENGEPGKGAKFTITIPKLNKSGQENYQIVP